MNKQDLKQGEYYYRKSKDSNTESIMLIDSIHRAKNIISGNKYYNQNWLLQYWDNLRLATPEEKHWLNKCIELNKYITKEEAMKSFKVEFVKCLETINNYTKDKIYCVNSIGYMLGDNRMNDKKYNSWLSTFTPSTKEEYDAQFVVKKEYKGVHVKTQEEFNYVHLKTAGSKLEWTNQIRGYGTCIKYFSNGFDRIAGREDVAQPFEEWCLQNNYTDFKPIEEVIVKEPEFVLPDKWFCRASNQEENTIIYTWVKRNSIYKSISTLFNGYDFICSDFKYSGVSESRSKNSPTGYTEITFEQFKKYVLKEDIIEELVQPKADAPIEEILEYCKKKYPVGTKCKGMVVKDEFIVDSEPFESPASKGNLSIKPLKEASTPYKYIYLNGKYAEIIEPIKQESFRTVEVQLESRVYSLEELTKALTKEYDKTDVEDILKVIKQIK